MPEQPNILVILSDQHSPHVLGCAGDAVVRTPVLDRLAAEGALFEHAYCPSPLCVPSRMTFLAARHCSEIGVWTNSCILSTETPTFVHGLGAAGYETILCGRMHFVGPDQRHGFHRRIIGDVDPSLGHIPLVTTGQMKSGVEVAGPGRTAYSAYDDAVTETCCRFLAERGREGADRPFFLVAGGVLPHCPYICPKRLFDEYYAHVDVPQLPDGALERLHPAMREWRRHRGVDELTDEQIRTARAAYYGLVTYMDERIGEILGALEASGFADNTLVVYTSDHGDMAGEHRMWWKSSFYEGSVGVPLLFRWPGRIPAGRRSDAVCSLVDVGPTLLDLGGANPLPEASGRSLAGFLGPEGRDPAWPDEAFAEAWGAVPNQAACMLRRGPWKLSCYQGYDQPQLFHLEEDPGEMHDRGTDPACASVREEMLQAVRARWSADTVARAMGRKATNSQLIRTWARAHPPVHPEDAGVKDRWTAPRDCNVFPEE